MKAQHPPLPPPLGPVKSMVFRGFLQAQQVLSPPWNKKINPTLETFLNTPMRKLDFETRDQFLSCTHCTIIMLQYGPLLYSPPLRSRADVQEALQYTSQFGGPVSTYSQNNT